MSFCRYCRASERGASMIEYGLLLMAIALAAILAVTGLGQTVQDPFYAVVEAGPGSSSGGDHSGGNGGNSGPQSAGGGGGNTGASSGSADDGAGRSGGNSAFVGGDTAGSAPGALAGGTNDVSTQASSLMVGGRGASGKGGSSGIPGNSGGAAGSVEGSDSNSLLASGKRAAAQPQVTMAMSETGADAALPYTGSPGYGLSERSVATGEGASVGESRHKEVGESSASFWLSALLIFLDLLVLGYLIWYVYRLIQRKSARMQQVALKRWSSL